MDDLSPKYYKNFIKKLQKLINDISGTFEQTDPMFTTNPIESFNHSRAMLASKNVAFHITWKIRLYISIIKWNIPN